MHVEFSGSFRDYTIFICKFKIDECFLLLFIHERCLVYKLETFKNCKEVKHIIIMTIAIIYIFYFMWYLINSWKVLSENPQVPPERIHYPLKLEKVQVPPFCQHWIFFSPPPSAEKGERTLWIKLNFCDIWLTFGYILVLSRAFFSETFTMHMTQNMAYNQKVLVNIF